MAKVNFIKVQGYEHIYCHVVNAEHEIKAIPIIGMYVDRKHSTVSVLDIHGVVHKLGCWPTAYHAMKCPDGAFSFCGCWFENQDAWQGFIRHDQAQTKAEAELEAEAEPETPGIIINKFYDRFTKLSGYDMGAAQTLLAEFKVVRLCKLEGKDFDAFDRRLTELGYGGEGEQFGTPRESGTRKTPVIKTKRDNHEQH
jgi:hypothetical protein